jgi:ubiquinone/menaquinone biosynthesis C-methylase UbiE
VSPPSRRGGQNQGSATSPFRKQAPVLMPENNQWNTSGSIGPHEGDSFPASKSDRLMDQGEGMSKRHKEAVQKQFAKTVEAFSKSAVRDTPEVLAEKVAFAKPQPSEISLDVACGPGELVLGLAPRLRFARGIDLTEGMLRQAREFQAQRRIGNAAFDRGDAEQLPYAAGAFDLVTCQCSIHHMPGPEAALREMVRVVRPEGRLMVIDSIAPEIDAKFELHNQIEKLRDPSHAATLRLTSLLRMFEDCGLEVARQSIKRRARSFNQWMLRAGIETSDKRYQQVRQLVEDSARGDRAGFSPQVEEADISIVHHEGMFLLTRKDG